MSLRRAVLAIAVIAALTAVTRFWTIGRQAGPRLDGDVRSLAWYSRSGDRLDTVAGTDAPYADLWFGTDEATVHTVLGGTNEGLWRIDLQTGAISASEGFTAAEVPAVARLRHTSGNWLAFDAPTTTSAGGSRPGIWVAPRDGSRRAEPFPAMPVPLGGGRFSVDQRWMAYVSEESGPEEIYITTFPDSASRWLVSLPDGGRRPVWRSDSQELYYWAPGGRLMVSKLQRGDKLVLPALASLVFERPELADAPFAVTRDASRILIAAPR